MEETITNQMGNDAQAISRMLRYMLIWNLETAANG